MKTIVFFFLITSLHAQEFITVAILAKDKSATLPLYLACLEAQTWPKNQTYVYIRTNNNTDNTVEILKTWIEKVKDQYSEIYFDDSDLPERVQDYGPHEWNRLRCSVLGRIRKESCEWARQHKSHYFVADCDNFFHERTIEDLLCANVPVIAPFLTNHTMYSNYHAAIDENGYYADCQEYYDIYNRTKVGFFEVPVVHCMYLIRHEVLDKVCYDDGSGRFEYVIFSDMMRKQAIKQYIDNRKMYGRLTQGRPEEEPWYHEFAHLLKK